MRRAAARAGNKRQEQKEVESTQKGEGQRIQSRIESKTEVIKLKYDPWGRKFLFKTEERSTEWSDDESDYLVKPKPALPKQDGNDEACRELNVSIDDGRLPQIHVKTNDFNGTVSVDRMKNVLEFNKYTRNGKVFEKKTEKACTSFRFPIPHLPPHAVQSLGEGFLEYIWREFCILGVNKFGMLKFKLACQVMRTVEQLTGESIQLKDALDDDDYIGFDKIIDKVSQMFSKLCVVSKYNTHNL